MVSTQELELQSKSDDVIVEGSTWAAIWHMSWPILLQMLTIALASFADVWVAGRLGSDAQAAIGIGGQVWLLMVLFAIALSSGTTALVSRYWGARDYDQTIEACRQSLLFSVIFGVSSVTLGLLIAQPFLHVLGASPTVEKVGWQFLQVDLLSQIPFTVLWVVNAIFRAKGNARTPMLLWALMTAMIITLDCTLCLGPFHLGVAGIGAAWLIAGVVGTALGLYLLGKSDVADCLNAKLIVEHGLSKEWIMRILNVGLPACIQDLAWVGGNFLLFFIFAKTANPTACQASWAVGFRAEEMIAGMPIYALSMAVATIVGQNLGAQKPERAVRAGWQVATIGSAYNVIVGVILVLLAGPIAHYMSTDATVVEYTTQYFQINGFSEPFLAMWLILFGAMQGAGYTKWPMWASSLCMTVMRLPIAWYLTINMHWGPTGTWLGMAVCTVTIGLLAVWRFQSGVWKYQKV